MFFAFIFGLVASSSLEARGKDGASCHGAMEEMVAIRPQGEGMGNMEAVA